jgi:signal transduction histidine kinase
MKLLTKTSLLYLLFAVPVMIVCSFLCFELIHEEVIESTDESLMRDFSRLETKFFKKDSLINFTSFNGEVSVRPSFEHYNKTSFHYSNTEMYDEFEDEILPFRVLTVMFHSPFRDYDITIRKIHLESDELAEEIIAAVSIMFGLLLIGFFAINYFVSKNLWKPFYKTLASLGNYDLNKKNTIKFDSASTQEFRQLNNVLNQMTKKIQNDYQNLKEFTENASHEIQTPLAIIRSKLELMIQAEDISAEQMKQVQEIYESTNRLSKLNQSLLLLAKIENHQFHEIQVIKFKELIENKLIQFEEMIVFKNIKVETSLIDLQTKMNAHLADILLSNIIGNAIRHNVHDGKIKIELNTNSLSVSNSGNPLSISPEKLFERFQKASPSDDSVGLGLAIVKQICDAYNFKINYQYSEKTHTITISF